MPGGGPAPDKQAATEPVDQLRLMGDGDDREPARVPEPRDSVHEPRDVRRVERRRRLVEQERLGVSQQPASNRHTLLLAAGQRRAVSIEEAGVEPHLGEGLHQPRLRQCGTGRVRLHQEVASHCPLEEDRRLEDQRRAPPKLEWVERPDVAIPETDATSRRLHEAVQASEKSRFPRTRRTHQRKRRAAVDLERTSVRIGTAACPGPAGYSSDTWSN